MLRLFEGSLKFALCLLTCAPSVATYLPSRQINEHSPVVQLSMLLAAPAERRTSSRPCFGIHSGLMLDAAFYCSLGMIPENLVGFFFVFLYDKVYPVPRHGLSMGWLVGRGRAGRGWRGSMGGSSGGAGCGEAPIGRKCPLPR